MAVRKPRRGKSQRRRAYLAFMRSPEWRAIQKRHRESKQPHACVVCGSKRYDLHHQTYVRFGGKERLVDLLPLCRVHHREVHTYHKANGGDLYVATKKVVALARRREQSEPNRSGTSRSAPPGHRS